MLKEQRTWILAADSAKAKLFEWLPQNHSLQEIACIDEEDARKPERDLRSDRSGHGAGFNSKVRYTLEEHSSYKQQASDIFLHKLAQFLDAPDIQTEFDALVVVAPTNIYQTIQGELSPNGQHKITKHHAKNLTNMPKPEFTKYYTNHLI